jgi:hypothetical protein
MVVSTKNLTETGWKILINLGVVKDDNKYSISKVSGVSYAGIHKTIKQLLNLYLIEISRTEKSSKNPKMDVEYYKLSKVGLFNALTRKITWDYINEIAQVQSDNLPLIFGKWEFFKENKILEKIIYNLKIGVIENYEPLSHLSLGEYYNYEKDKGKMITITKDLYNSLGLDTDPYTISRAAGIIMRDISYVLTQAALRVHGFEHESYLIDGELEFMKILKQDKELREFISTEIKDKLDNSEMRIKSVKTWKIKFENL